MARDPVCGMDVDAATAKEKFEYSGKTYVFCSKGCRLEFQDQPERYLSPSWRPGHIHGRGWRRFHH